MGGRAVLKHLIVQPQPGKHITTSDPPSLLPPSICLNSNIHHTATISLPDKSRLAHDTLGGLCDTGSWGEVMQTDKTKRKKCVKPWNVF